MRDDELGVDGEAHGLQKELGDEPSVGSTMHSGPSIPDAALGDASAGQAPQVIDLTAGGESLQFVDCSENDVDTAQRILTL